jgi:hypothetical protein
MNKNAIIDAYVRIRTIDNTIPDDVLDFMKNSALKQLEGDTVNMIDNTWLTEEYLNSLGYYKVSDDGQYGEYACEHWKVKSLTYGMLPKDYRKIKFNRDGKYGVFMSISADWSTRYSVNNVLVLSKEIFETLLGASI